MAYSTTNSDNPRELNPLFGGLGPSNGRPVLNTTEPENRPHTFTWTNDGVVADEYRHLLGSTPGGDEIGDSGWIPATQAYQSFTVTPGARMYQTLQYRLGGGKPEEVTHVYGSGQNDTGGVGSVWDDDTFWDDDTIWED